MNNDALETAQAEETLVTSPVEETGGDIAATIASMPEGALVVVDFDETLFLRNSTETFLDRCAPTLITLLLTRAIERLKPWRLLRPAPPDFAARDWLRVVAVAVSLPWSLSLWRKRAPAIARTWLNRDLAEILRSRSDLRLVVATHGFRPIVAPLLAAMDIDAELIATPLRGGIASRLAGKRRAIERRFGPEALTKACVITDNGEDDRDLIEAAEHAHVALWPEARYVRAFDRAYVPLGYITRAKYAGQDYLTTVILRRECVLLIIASALASTAPFTLALAFPFLMFSFFTVFEIGHEENDRLGLQLEERPSTTPEKRAWQGRIDEPVAWAAAIALAAPGLALILWAEVSGWRAVLPGWEESALIAGAWLTGMWCALLAIARGTFWLFNRLDEHSRLFLYFPLQAVKGVGVIAILQLPLAILGGALLVAEAASRWTPYLVYRLTGERHEIKHQILRLELFLAIGLAAACFAPWSEIATFAGLAAIAWCVFRVRHEARAAIAAARWLPARAASSRTERPPR